MDTIAVEHYNSNGHSVRIENDTYTWVSQHNISMAWVKEEHLSRVLGIRTKSCCNNNRNRFLLASEVNICIWKAGDRCR